MLKVGNKVVVIKNSFSKLDDWAIGKTGIITEVINLELIKVIWYLVRFDNNKNLIFKDEEIKLYINKYNLIKII